MGTCAQIIIVLTKEVGRALHLGCHGFDTWVENYSRGDVPRDREIRYNVGMVSIDYGKVRHFGPKCRQITWSIVEMTRNCRDLGLNSSA